MPKTIRTKSNIGLINYAKKSGHIKPNITQLVNDVVDYTTTTIVNTLTNNTQQYITINTRNSSIPLIEQINISNTLLQKNIELIENISKEKCPEISIPNIPEIEIKKIYYEFISPYLTIAPYKLPPYSEFQRLIELIDKELIDTTIENDYKLRLYRGLLDVLTNGRNRYFSEIQFETENKMLRNKICNLEELVMKYSKELASYHGIEDGFYLAGSFGIRLRKPKNLIYAQAILDINLAWYMYLYNTKKIDYDKYNGVVEFVKEKGDSAYNELIQILDEKFKDIEDVLNDNICTSNSSNNSSNDCVSDSKSDTYSSCTTLSRNSSFCSDYNNIVNYCDLPFGSDILILNGSFNIIQPQKFSKNKDKHKHKHKHKYNKSDKCKQNNFITAPDSSIALILPGEISISQPVKFKGNLDNCNHNKDKTKRKNKQHKHKTNKCKQHNYITTPDSSIALILPGEISITQPVKFKGNLNSNTCKIKKESNKHKHHSHYTTKKCKQNNFITAPDSSIALILPGEISITQPVKFKC